jgi:hypothetical protein
MTVEETPEQRLKRVMETPGCAIRTIFQQA